MAGLAAGAGPSLAADWGLGSLLGWVGSLRGRAQDASEEGLPSTDAPDTTQHGNCVAWAEHGYCYAGANQQYMQQSCADECEQGQRAGTIPEPGKLWQAPILDCHGYRLRGACGSHASFMCVAPRPSGAGTGRTPTPRMPRRARSRHQQKNAALRSLFYFFFPWADWLPAPVGCCRLIGSPARPRLPARRSQHCEEVCSSSTVELPPSDILSQIGALLLLGGFCYAVFRGSKLALTYDAQLSWHTRRAINMETAAETAALATDKAKGGRKKSTTYSERMQTRRGEKEKAKKS